jgi:hypothetical protein
MKKPFQKAHRKKPKITYLKVFTFFQAETLSLKYVHIATRVARFSKVQYTKTGKIYQLNTNYSNGHKIYHMAVKYSKWSSNTYTYLRFPFQGPPKYIQIGIFGRKLNHLATLIATYI